MNLDNISCEIRVFCRACGNDEFECDDAVDDLAAAPGETELTCTYCGLKTTNKRACGR